MRAESIMLNEHHDTNLPITVQRANDPSQVRMTIGGITIWLDLLDAQALAKGLRKAHGRVQRKPRGQS